MGVDHSPEMLAQARAGEPGRVCWQGANCAVSKWFTGHEIAAR